MSIQGKVRELQSIQQELKSLRERGSKLRKREKLIKNEINDYLEATDQPGFTYNKMAILREEKNIRKTKPKADQQHDAIRVLKEYGVENPEKALSDIMDARKGSPTVKHKLVFKKYKEQDY